MKQLLCLLVLCGAASAQVYTSSTFQNSPGNYGRAVPYSQVTLCISTDTAVPCTHKAATFTDDSLGTQCTATAASGVLTGAPVSGANCNNPGIADAAGNFTLYVVPGNYRLCIYSQTWFCAEISVGGSGNSGVSISCPGALYGSLAAFISAIAMGCDVFSGTDFAGNLFGQSFSARGANNGFIGLTGGLTDSGSLTDTNTFYWLAPDVVPTPYSAKPPPAPCTDGQVWQQFSHSGTVMQLDCLTPSFPSVSITATSPIVVTPSPILGAGVISCPTCVPVRGISFTIGDPAGSALTAASTTTDYVTVPFGCTITAYNIAIDAGTITLKFWKIATGTAIPTSSDSINTSGVGISSGTAIHSTTLSDFTTSTITANDIMAMNVTAVATAKYVNGVIACQ